ncbi:unnamed protein product [Phyllotreta striolata]|uniref:Uncharacterized protein n=1 Tax=Phyllotreta striolata TaxID=444603 RepID=A0A9N9TKL3_PHYSR|nr:unnamed protein product [Phyllotreta striolata]
MKHFSDDNISKLYGKKLKLTVDSSSSSLNSYPGDEDEGELYHHFANKRICAMCEPLFMNSLSEVDRNFKKLLIKYKQAIKDEVERLFEAKGSKQWCMICDPELSYEVKRIQNRYQHLIDSHFSSLAQKTSKFHNTNFYNRFTLKASKR